MHTLLQAATMPHDAPTTWQLLVALAGVASLCLFLITLGIVYGKVITRIEVVEKGQRESAKHAEMIVMFQDIKDRLRRIEDHFDRSKE